MQGSRDDKQYKKIKSYFDNLIFLPTSQAAFIKSADVYRSLRKKGITIRKPVDCIIVSVAIAHEIPLLHNDRDFDRIEDDCGLRTIKENE